MKVVFVSAYFYPVTGGAENHMYYIAKELVKRGHDVEVFVSDSSRTGRIKEKESTIDGIKIKRFKTWFKISLSGMFFPGLFSAVKNSNADILHIHGHRHPFTYAVYFGKRKSLLTPHWPDYPKGIRKNWVDFLVSSFDKFFGSSLLKKFDRICVVNQLEIPWTMKFGIPRKKIKLTPNCIPKEYLKKVNGATFRKKWKIKKNELMVLCLCRLHKSKGLDQVIKVAPYFQKARFVFVGVDGGFRVELEKLVKKLKLKNVIFTGKVSEKEKLQAYAAADIFCHPSHFEAFGISVLEAMAQQTAVLTSNSGGLPWVVGQEGLIFQDNNLNDLRNKLEKLIKNKNLREKLAKAGRKKAEGFTWDKTVDKIEKIYLELLKK